MGGLEAVSHVCLKALPVIVMGCHVLLHNLFFLDGKKQLFHGK